ncbi:hypothetical protein FQR65_LT20536 [Abscondita terminalis]|nr:hypothetical protein FQR65_LT20536 [Abscondita terminalis]
METGLAHGSMRSRQNRPSGLGHCRLPRLAVYTLRDRCGRATGKPYGKFMYGPVNGRKPGSKNPVGLILASDFFFLMSAGAKKRGLQLKTLSGKKQPQGLSSDQIKPAIAQPAQCTRWRRTGEKAAIAGTMRLGAKGTIPSEPPIEKLRNRVRHRTATHRHYQRGLRSRFRYHALLAFKSKETTDESLSPGIPPPGSET